MTKCIQILDGFTVQKLKESVDVSKKIRKLCITFIIAFFYLIFLRSTLQKRQDTVNGKQKRSRASFLLLVD